MIPIDDFTGEPGGKRFIFLLGPASKFKGVFPILSNFDCPISVTHKSLSNVSLIPRVLLTVPVVGG